MMRAGRFGSKAGRVAVVVAFVLGTLVAGTTAASADELAGGTFGAAIGRAAEASSDTVVTTLISEWG
jgi:hypothetical protein